MSFSSSYNINTFYLTYKNIHPSWLLISCALTLGSIAAIGIIFNISVIFVAIRSKSLHGTINYLLMLYSFFEMLHQTGHFLFVYTALSGQNFIEYRLATKINIISAFGIGGVFPTMFFTGIDRLIGILFTEIHDKIKIRLYLAVITFICTIFCFASCISFYFKMELYGDQMITGTLGDFFDGSALDIVYILIVSLTFIVYIIVGIVIRTKSYGLPSAESISARAFRSLFCIIALNIGGYFILLFYLLLIKPRISSPITSWLAQQITAIPLNIGAASNGPILYFTSTEYRHAYRTQFLFIFKRMPSANRTAPAPLQQNMPCISSVE